MAGIICCVTQKGCKSRSSLFTNPSNKSVLEGLKLSSLYVFAHPWKLQRSIIVKLSTSWNVRKTPLLRVRDTEIAKSVHIFSLIQSLTLPGCTHEAKKQLQRERYVGHFGKAMQVVHWFKVDGCVFSFQSRFITVSLQSLGLLPPLSSCYFVIILSTKQNIVLLCYLQGACFTGTRACA